MGAGALRAGVGAYVARFAGRRGGDRRRLVVRTGYDRSREVLTSAGAVEVTTPRICGKRTGPVTGERGRFCPAIVPPWAGKTPKVTGVLPLLYMHGRSGGDFVYLWADGIDVNIGLEEHQLCLLVMTGVRADGREELIVLAWFRKTASVLAALPGSAHPGAKKALAGILIERPEPAAA
jgi:hypothetical protein